MTALERISKKDLKELLNQGWMTHDSMWLGHCQEEVGIETTNRINTAAVKSMAKIEARRLKRALGLKRIESMDDLRLMILESIELVMPEFMKFELTFPDNDTMRWRWEQEQCFAYRGIKRIGLIDKYQCGIFPRLEGWLESLGIEYTMEPQISGCLMHAQGNCQVDFKFNLPQTLGN